MPLAYRFLYSVAVSIAHVVFCSKRSRRLDTRRERARAAQQPPASRHLRRIVANRVFFFFFFGCERRLTRRRDTQNKQTSGGLRAPSDSAARYAEQTNKRRFAADGRTSNVFRLVDFLQTKKSARVAAVAIAAVVGRRRERARA